MQDGVDFHSEAREPSRSLRSLIVPPFSAPQTILSGRFYTVCSVVTSSEVVAVAPVREALSRKATENFHPLLSDLHMLTPVMGSLSSAPRHTPTRRQRPSC